MIELTNKIHLSDSFLHSYESILFITYIKNQPSYY
jgi:hypothetical protein